MYREYVVEYHSKLDASVKSVHFATKAEADTFAKCLERKQYRVSVWGF